MYFTHLLADGYLCWFHDLAIVSSWQCFELLLDRSQYVINSPMCDVWMNLASTHENASIVWNRPRLKPVLECRVQRWDEVLPESSSQPSLRRLSRFRKSHVNFGMGTQKPRAEDEPQERAWEWLQEAPEDFQQWLSWLNNIQGSVVELPEPSQVCFFGQVWWRTHTCLLQVARAKGLQDMKKETINKQEHKRRSRSQSSAVV